MGALSSCAWRAAEVYSTSQSGLHQVGFSTTADRVGSLAYPQTFVDSIFPQLSRLSLPFFFVHSSLALLSSFAISSSRTQRLPAVLPAGIYPQQQIRTPLSSQQQTMPVDQHLAQRIISIITHRTCFPALFLTTHLRAYPLALSSSSSRCTQQDAFGMVSSRSSS